MLNVFGEKQSGEHIGMRTGVLVASSFFAVAFLAACAPGDPKGSPIQTAPKTEVRTFLDSCSLKANLGSEFMAFAGKPAKVCRLDKEGKPVEMQIQPSYQSARYKGRVAIRQNVVVNLELAKDIQSTENQDRATLAATSFLNTHCAPLLREVFNRSGLVADVKFHEAVKLDAATVAAGSEDTGSKTIDKTASEAQDAVAPEGEKVQTEFEKQLQALGANKTAVVPQEELSLEFLLNVDGNLVLKNELFGVSSWPILDKSEEAAAKMARQEFCSQVVSRIGESFGAVKGRDCASRESLHAKQADGLGVSQKLALDLNEIKSILSPVCVDEASN
ncbi:MAG: hypothetical protein RBT63_03700 [Bdellovibrionales bacterium]|nr:hypothetical protein [Bdellovibrionales bacterium]